MIKTIKPSSYKTVWALDTGAPEDGDGLSFEKPIVWNNHSVENNTRCNYTAPIQQYFYILVSLNANTSYQLTIGSYTGPNTYELMFQNDDSIVLKTMSAYDASVHSFTVETDGFYILRGSVYYTSGSEEYLYINPAPNNISGEANWFIDKSRIKPGIWDKNGVLTKYNDINSAGVKYTKIPSIPKNGLFAYYPLVNDFKDYSGNHRDLVLSGNLIISKETGITDFSINNNICVSDFVSGENPRSICLWFRFKGSSTNEQSIFCQGIESYGSNFAITRCDDNYLRAHTYGWSDNSYVLPNKNDLHHLVVTYSSQPSIARLMYIDGSLVKNWTAQTSTANTPLFFGVWANGDEVSSNIQSFQGYINDIALYDRSITSDEVSQIYNSGNSLS